MDIIVILAIVAIVAALVVSHQRAHYKPVCVDKPVEVEIVVNTKGRYRVIAGNKEYVGDSAYAAACIEAHKEKGVPGKLYLDKKLVKEF